MLELNDVTNKIRHIGVNSPEITNSGPSCLIYTDEIHPESCSFSFHSHQPVWNNKTDPGYIYNAAGEEVSMYCF